MDLRANTAVDVLIGPFVDKTDGNTTEDSLTLTQAEIKLSKLGQGLAQKNDATSAVFDDDGYYNCELDATDTNTEGNLVLIVHQSANALPVRHEFNVMAEAAYDSLYIAKDSGFMEVSLTAGAITDATLAGNMEIVFETDFATNYNTTRNAWATNYTDFIGTIGNASFAAGALTSTEITSATGITINAASVDLIWDEVLTGATHNVASSSGRRLRTLSALVFEDGTAQSGGNNSIQLASGDITADNEFVRSKVIIVGGTGEGQEAIITDSVASTDTLTITPAWLVNPDATSEYEVIPGQTHTTVQNGGYDNARVYVDTVSGVAGQLTGVNGTSTNPSSNLTDAYVIATANMLSRFEILPGSAITLPASSTNRQFLGLQYTIALNSADIDNSTFDGASSVTGIATTGSSNPPFFTLCAIGAVTLPPSGFFQCAFFGVMTIGIAGGTFTIGGSATTLGLTLTIDYGSGLNSSEVFVQSWGGGVIEIQNAGAGTGTYVLKLNGEGDLTVNANCSDTTNIDLHGNIELTNNSAITSITKNSNYDLTTILSDSTAFQGADVAAILVDTVNIQSRLPAALSSGNMKCDALAISTSAEAADNLEASAETIVIGAAETGTLSTTVMTTNLTEATDDHYNGRIIIWTSGVLQDQATDITDYSGTNGTLTFTAVTEAPSNTDSFIIV